MTDRDLSIEEQLAGRRLEGRAFWRMVGLLRPVRRLLSVAVVAEVILVATILVRPWFFQQTIDLGLPGPGHETIDWVVIGWMCAGLTGTWLMRFVMFGINRWCLGLAAVQVLGALRERVFEHVQGLSVRYFDLTRAGRVVSRADRDADALEGLLIEGPPVALSVSLRFIGASIGLYLLAPFILVWLMPLVPCIIIAMVAYKRLGTRLYGAISEAKSRVTAHLVEGINGVRVVQQATCEERSRATYDGLLDHLYRRECISAWGWAWIAPVITVMFLSGLMIVLWRGGWAVGGPQPEMSIGEMTQCLFYVFLFLGPLADVGNLYERMSQGIAAAQRIFLLLDTPAEVVDAPDARKVEHVSGALAFEGVHFAYDPAAARQQRWVLNGIDLRIAPGETLAIVGPTGHGKSTLIQLLARFYDVQVGRITIDGVDVRDLQQRSLRRHIGIVLQDNVLFTGSILDNLRLARPAASDAELIAACRELGADVLLERLSHAYETQVGPRGSHLSHGQRQLVCLVRAFVADPAVLVLDEATSAVDAYTERRIQLALRRLTEGRTAIIVAHRLVTIRDADRIVVVRKGQIAESGDHGSLLAAGGHYAALYGSQHQGEEAVEV